MNCRLPWISCPFELSNKKWLLSSIEYFDPIEVNSREKIICVYCLHFMRKFSTHTHRHPMTVNYHIACNSITFNFRPLSINRIAHVQSSFSTTVCYAKQVSYRCTKSIDERLRVKFVRYILTLPQYCQSLPSQSHSISLYFLHYSLVELNLFFDKINEFCFSYMCVQ